MGALLITRLLGEWEGWARKSVNHTNRMVVVCCHLIDRPQSVPQLSCKGHIVYQTV